MIEDQEIDKIAKRVENLALRVHLLPLEALKSEVRMNKEQLKIYKYISELPVSNRKGIDAVVENWEMMKLVKHAISSYLQKESMRALGFFDEDFNKTLKMENSEREMYELQKGTIWSKTPDFVSDGKLGDIKVDFTGTMTVPKMKELLKEKWGLLGTDKLIVILIKKKNLTNYLPRDIQSTAEALMTTGTLINMTEVILEENKELFKNLGLKAFGERKVDMIEEALEKIPREHKEKFLCREMDEFLNQDFEEVTEEDYLRVFEKYVNILTQRLIESSIGAPEMVEKLKETFKATEEDEEWIKIKKEVEENIKKESDLIMEIKSIDKKIKNMNIDIRMAGDEESKRKAEEMLLIMKMKKENKKLEMQQIRETTERKKLELEAILKEDFGHGNLRNLPIGVEREVITGEEVIEGVDENFEDDLELAKKLIHIRGVENKNLDSTEKKLKMTELKREKQILKTSKLTLDRTDLIARAMTIEKIDKKIKELKEKINDELQSCSMNSDGSYNLNLPLIQSLRSGAGLKFYSRLIINTRSGLELLIEVYRDLIEEYEERLEEFERENVDKKTMMDLNKKIDIIDELIVICVMEQEKIEESVRKKEAHKDSRAKVESKLLLNAAKNLGLKYGSEAFEYDCLKFLAKREIKKRMFAEKRQMPAENWGIILEHEEEKLVNLKELPIPKIMLEGFSDIKAKQTSIEVINKDFESIILTHLKKDTNLRILAEEVEILRGIVMFGKPRNFSDEKKSSPWSVVYYKNLDLMLMIGNQSSDYNTATIRVMFKAKSYSRGFLGLKYSEFRVQDSEFKLFLSDPFKLNKKFTENWLEIYGAGLGLSVSSLAYGNEKNWRSDALRLLQNPKKQFIELLDVNYFILGNATKRLNFGGKIFESKLEVVSNEVRIANWLDKIINNLEKITLESKPFFQNDELIKGKSQSRLDIRSPLIREWVVTKRLQEQEKLKNQTEVLLKKEEELKLEVSFENKEKISMEIATILKSMTVRKKVIKNLEERAGVEGVTIKNKQMMLILVYLRQILPKAIPNDEKKMKSDFFKREAMFNSKALSDRYSNRNYEGFIMSENIEEFFEFIMEDKEDIWNSINTSLPGFTYFIQKKILSEHMDSTGEKGVGGTDIGIHPVSTSVSSKTNFIVDEKEFLYNAKKQEERAKAVLSNLKKIKDISAKEFSAMAEKRLGEELVKSNKERLDDNIKEHFIKEALKKEEKGDGKESILFKKISKMDPSEIKTSVKKILKEIDGKNKEYFRIRSEFTADALYREVQEMKKTFNLPEDADVTMADLIVHDIVYKGAEVILTLELKEQKGGKRAFFVQNISARDLNAFYDALSFNVLKNCKEDGITASGDEKYIKLQNLMAKMSAKDFCGLTGDKAKYGDTHPLRPFVEGIIAKYKTGYIGRYEAIASLHAVRGLLNRKLLVPKDLLKDYTKAAFGNMKQEKASLVETKYSKPMIDYYLGLVNEVKINNDEMFREVQHPFLNSAKGGNLIREIQSKNAGLLKEAGFTLGVLNMESTLIAVGAIRFHELASKTWFPWVEMVALAHSDDTIHFFNLKSADMPFLRKMRNKLKKKNEIIEGYSIFEDVKLIEEDKKKGGKLMSIIQTAMCFLSFRMVGQVMSLAKCSLSNDYAEMLQVYNIMTEEEEISGEEKMPIKYLNVTVPLLRYAVNLGNRGTFSSYSDSLRQRMNASLDFLRNGGNILGCYAVQYLSNWLTMVEFNLDEASVAAPVEAFGAMFVLPEDLINQGFIADTCRLITNRTGSRVYKQIVIDPTLTSSDESEQKVLQGDVTSITKSNGMYKERKRTVKINFSTDRDSASRFSYLMKEAGLESNRLGDAINEIRKEKYLEELLGATSNKVVFLRIITKHNSKLFNDARTTMPRNIIERGQMGLRERDVEIENWRGKKAVRIKVRMYVEELMSAALSEEELPVNKGYDLMEKMYEEEVLEFKSNLWEIKEDIPGSYLEPNVFVRKATRFAETKFEEYIPALGLCSEMSRDPKNNLDEIIRKSRTKLLRPIIMTEAYKPKIKFMIAWLKTLLGEFWKIEDKSMITGVKEILKDYIEEKNKSLIYKGFGKNMKENIRNIYKFNYFVTKGKMVSNETEIIMRESKLEEKQVDFSLNESIAIIETDRILNRELNKNVKVIQKGFPVEVEDWYVKKTFDRCLKTSRGTRFILDGMLSCLMWKKARITTDFESGVNIEAWDYKWGFGKKGLIINENLMAKEKKEIGNLIRICQYILAESGLLKMTKDKKSLLVETKSETLVRELETDEDGDFMDSGVGSLYLKRSFNREKGNKKIFLDRFDTDWKKIKIKNNVIELGRGVFPTVFDLTGIFYETNDFSFELTAGKMLKGVSFINRELNELIYKYNALELSIIMNCNTGDLEEDKKFLNEKAKVLVDSNLLEEVKEIIISEWVESESNFEKNTVKIVSKIMKKKDELEFMARVFSAAAILSAQVTNGVDLRREINSMIKKYLMKKREIKYSRHLQMSVLKLELNRCGIKGYVTHDKELQKLSLYGTVYQW